MSGADATESEKRVESRSYATDLSTASVALVGLGGNLGNYFTALSSIDLLTGCNLANNNVVLQTSAISGFANAVLQTSAGVFAVLQNSAIGVFANVAGRTQSSYGTAVAIGQTEETEKSKPGVTELLSEQLNSTVQRQRSATILRIFIDLLQHTRDEIFEDGMESPFSRELLYNIARFGNEGVEILTELILSEQANPEVTSEALRWMGSMDDPSTHRSRLSLLERSLRSFFPKIRDAAILGIAFLNDPAAIPALELALRTEPVEELRQDMAQVLEDLQRQNAADSEKNSQIQMV